jgi:hypothetical protein
MQFPALSVIQPWAWLLLRPDIVGDEARAQARARGLIKDVENRGWETGQRGWVLLHASATRLPLVARPKEGEAKVDWQSAAMFAGKRGVEVPLQIQLPHGAVVGAMRIDGCDRFIRSPWFMGPVGLVIGAAVPFAKPVPAKGALKFFTLPAKDTGAGGLEQAMEIAERIRAAGLAAEFKL